MFGLTDRLDRPRMGQWGRVVVTWRPAMQSACPIFLFILRGDPRPMAEVGKRPSTFLHCENKARKDGDNAVFARRQDLRSRCHTYLRALQETGWSRREYESGEESRG